MQNAQVARLLRDIAAYLEMEAEPFKPRAYERAASSIESLDESVADVYAKGGVKALQQIAGVGKSMAEKIEELVTTGRVAYYEDLKKAMPVDIGGLTAIEGLGPKMVKALYGELGIRNVAELEEAARAGKLRSLPHFGERSERKILKGIEFLKQSSGRFVLGSILPLVREVQGRLAALAEVTQVAVAGSIRRWKEQVGDADLLVVSSKPQRVMEFFVAMPEVVHVYGQGATKTMVRLESGLDMDLRVVGAECFGAALSYFTGSKAHNVALRKIAQEQGLKLNEYGLFRGERRIAGETEEEIYTALGLAYVAPELREDRGEIEAARAGRLPRLIEFGAVRGDLQIQTTWTDGANSIEEMAREAKRLGLEYIAITDHTRSLAMTHGSDEAKLLRQMAEIDRLNRRLRGIRLLKSAEVNINRDGTLDIADEVLAKLDLVGAAVHSHFNLPRREMTERLERAMHHPWVDIIFHPTGRVIQKREPYELDIDHIIATAKRTGTALEIDAFPDRLDLKDEHVRKAVEAGVKLTVDSDAHSIHHIRYLEFGVAQARRGWATKDDVINTKPVGDFLRSLKRARRPPSRLRKKNSSTPLR